MRMLWLIAVTLFFYLPGVSNAQTTGSAAAVVQPSIDASINSGLNWFVAQEFRRRDVTAFSHWLAEMLEKSAPSVAAVLRKRGQEIYQTKSDDYLLCKLIGGKTDVPMDKPMSSRYQPFFCCRGYRPESWA